MKNLVKCSVFISYVLRHGRDKLDINMDKQGWMCTIDLQEECIKVGHEVTLDDLKVIVSSDDKSRYSFTEDFSKIRANQGHSVVGIDLGLSLKEPPEYLYHGTTYSAYDSIKSQGLLPMKRQHVHLSADIETAKSVARRRRSEYRLLLTVRSLAMYKDGQSIYLSDNGVWLTDKVLPIYIMDKIIEI